MQQQGFFGQNDINHQGESDSSSSCGDGGGDNSDGSGGSFVFLLRRRFRISSVSLRRPSCLQFFSGVLLRLLFALPLPFCFSNPFFTIVA